MLDVIHPTLYLVHIEICISGEVLTNGRVNITQSTVKRSATQTDHYCHEAKQEEQQAGVSPANIYEETQKEGCGWWVYSDH